MAVCIRIGCLRKPATQSKHQWLRGVTVSLSFLVRLGVSGYRLNMKLRLLVVHDIETGRWSAIFPELPGCASAGDTEDEAVANAHEALALWFEPAPIDVPQNAKVLEVALP
jgi:predicted RNase H-like HicB family nuclease